MVDGLIRNLVGSSGRIISKKASVPYFMVYGFW